MKKVIIADKSFAFAARIVNLHNYLVREKREYHISKQIRKSGTSICANVAEAQKTQSTADFVANYKIVLKEANETKYWLRSLQETHYITEHEFESVYQDLLEILKILTAICKHYPQYNQR